MKTVEAVKKIKSKGNEASSSATNKNVICLECSRLFNDGNKLRAHMRNIHQVEQYLMTEKNYIFLPTVKSTYLRCFPCSSAFSTTLGYRIHILDKHNKGKLIKKQMILNFTFSFLEEPSQNFDPQVIANFEENAKMMVCLICGERFVSPNALIAHMLQVHGVEVRDSKYFTTIIGWFFLCFTKQASIY